jgi:FkbM family methyltransferase
MSKLKSNSQLGQDLKVLDYYDNLRGGFYIELGAFDGIGLSNTLLLQNEYDWAGVLIEPDRNTYNQLINNRPGNVCVNVPVYSESDKVVTFVESTDPFVSGIQECQGERQQHAEVISTYDRKTKTLTQILNDFGAPEDIHYMSLDTEGSELDILKGLDFNKYKIGYIDIEHNYIEPYRTDIKNYMISVGYTFKESNQWDDVYILV